MTVSKMTDALESLVSRLRPGHRIDVTTPGNGARVDVLVDGEAIATGTHNGPGCLAYALMECDASYKRWLVANPYVPPLAINIRQLATESYVGARTDDRGPEIQCRSVDDIEWAMFALEAQRACTLDVEIFIPRSVVDVEKLPVEAHRIMRTTCNYPRFSLTYEERWAVLLDSMVQAARDAVDRLAAGLSDDASRLSVRSALNVVVEYRDALLNSQKPLREAWEGETVREIRADGARDARANASA